MIYTDIKCILIKSRVYSWIKLMYLWKYRKS